MEEKELIRKKSNRYWWAILILLLLALLNYVSSVRGRQMASNWIKEGYYTIAESYKWKEQQRTAFVELAIAVFIFIISNCEMIVTDKRVYGKAMFGSKVDIPLSQISVVSTMGIKGLVLSTPSGKTRFIGLTKRNEIYKRLSDLIKKPIDVNSYDELKYNYSPIEVSQESRERIAEELAWFKDLYEEGTISKEDYEEKKKQLLGL